MGEIKAGPWDAGREGRIGTTRRAPGAGRRIAAGVSLGVVGALAAGCAPRDGARPRPRDEVRDELGNGTRDESHDEPRGEASDEPRGEIRDELRVDLAAAELDPAGWGPRAEVDGRACRPLLAGRGGVVPLACWWEGSLRPPKGSASLALVTFRDSAASPVRVEVFAGLPGRYEVHRVGGLADGEWKTARVPLPFDIICRVPGTDRTELVLYAPGGADVPVESVVITAGDPAADEALWAAETRDWTARVQGEARRKADGPEHETAAIPAAFAGERLVPFVRSTSRLVHCTSAPQEGECGVALRVRMATNETEPAQFGVHANGGGLTNVRVSLAPGGLVGPGGARLDADVELFAAEYSVVTSGKLFPQRLWPAYPVDIPEGRSHLFWANVTTRAARSKPGAYSGAITIEADGLAATRLPFEVEVLPIALLTMREAGLHMGGCTTGLLPAHELEFLVRQNHNSINLWYYGFAPEIVKRSRDDFDLDFTLCDEFMRGAREAGVENFVFFLGGDPYGFPDTLHLERELYRRVYYDGDDMMAGRIELLRKTGAAPEAIIPELRPLYVKWVRKFMSHAREAGWPEPLLTPYDEPAKWVQRSWAESRLYFWRDPKDGGDRLRSVRLKDVDAFMKERAAEGVEPELVSPGGAGEWIRGHFKDSCAAIHEGWPDARIYASIHHADPGIIFLEDVEVFCTNAIHEDPRLGDKVRAGGPTKTFWQYSGTGDHTEPAAGRYAFGFFFGAFDSRGSLCWAYNWGSRFDTSSGNQWLYGWTTPYGVVRAPFMEGAREAWDDRRYIETLKVVAKRAGREKEATALLDEVLDAAVKTRTAGGRDTVNDFWARTGDPDALDTMRARIADRIVEIQGR